LEKQVIVIADVADVKTVSQFRFRYRIATGKQFDEPATEENRFLDGRGRYERP
jgi:hypothetical protein